MTTSEEKLKENIIDRELRGGEEPLDEERLPANPYESDQDTADTTPAEAMNEADKGKGIIEKIRNGL